jgi:hypothetical protein
MPGTLSESIRFVYRRNSVEDESFLIQKERQLPFSVINAMDRHKLRLRLRLDWTIQVELFMAFGGI